MKQKDAVYAAHVEFNGDRKAMVEKVAAGLKDGSVDWNNTTADDKACLHYASALVSNWVKKDERIAGGTYTPAKPRGPRASAKDEQLAKLNEVLEAAKVHSPEHVSVIESKIAARKAELEVAKSAKKVMSADALEETLMQLGLVEESAPCEVTPEG